MKLRECPFCGSKRVEGRMKMIGYEQEWVIICYECKALMTFNNDEDETIGDVNDRYNRRAGDQS